MPRVPTPRPISLLGLGIGVMGHGIAWAAYWLLQIPDAPTASIPAWAALALHFGGPELIMAVFSLASMLPLMAGVQEIMNDGRPRLARALGLACAAVALALAWRWYAQGRPILCALAIVCSLPGLLGPAPPKPPPDAPPPIAPPPIAPPPIAPPADPAPAP